MTLDDITKILGCNADFKCLEKINKIETDSRKIEKNDVFIALKGKNYDGFDYVDEAFSKGALFCITNNSHKNCIVVEDTYLSLYKISDYIRNQYKNIPLIGITGSNGKTTTKDLISYILESKYKVLKNEESKNNIIGISQTLFKMNDNYDIIVLELGSNHMGEISTLSLMTNPDIGVITNIGSSHLEYFKNKKNIFKEKTSILDGIENKKLIVNGDDKYLKKLKCYKCGINKKNDLVAHHIVCDINKLSFKITLDKEYKIVFNNPGIHFINDILLAIKVCLDYDINIKTIIKRIKNFKMTDKRMNIINKNNNVIINDCYNASYESIKAGIDYLKRIDNKKIIILADMLELGKYSKRIHKKVNKKLKVLSNKEIYTIGNYSKYIKGKHFDNTIDFIDYLSNLNINNSYIYVKGSRRMNLDKVVDYLLK